MTSTMPLFLVCKFVLDGSPNHSVRLKLRADRSVLIERPSDLLRCASKGSVGYDGLADMPDGPRHIFN